MAGSLLQLGRRRHLGEKVLQIQDYIRIVSGLGKRKSMVTDVHICELVTEENTPELEREAVCRVVVTSKTITKTTKCILELVYTFDV
jgi:hypothetical protein